MDSFVYSPMKRDLMTRRNAIRQKKSFLDEEQTKDALKVLGKYVKAKYGIVGGAGGSMDLVGDAEQPLSRAKTTERQPTISTPFSENGPLSPIYSMDGLEMNSVKEEIRFDRERETRTQYIHRLVVFFYNYLGLQHLLLLIMLICYALIGGYMFQSLEAPYEQQFLQKQDQISFDKRLAMSQRLIDLIRLQNCSNKLMPRKVRQEMGINLTRTQTDCEYRVSKFLTQFEEDLKEQWGIKNQWKWDFWNAVFYSGTLFTTIGYGNLACRTDYGRLATILYTLLGIPLMLMVLDSLGKAIFNWLQAMYLNFRRKLNSRVRDMKRAYLKRAATVELVSADEIDCMGVSENPTSDADLFKTFPLKLAIPLIFIYCFICSMIFRKWEDEWDYFTSFYFFFISLSTVGLGDVMPHHPRYACALFLAFIVGLALVSMCVSLMHQRVENRYMAALQLIDQEHQEALESRTPTHDDMDAETPKPTLGHKRTRTDQIAAEEDVILNIFRKNSIRLSMASLIRPSRLSQAGSMLGVNIPAWLAQTPTSLRFRNSPSSDSNQGLCLSPDTRPPSVVLGIFHAFQHQNSQKQAKTKPQHKSESFANQSGCQRPYSFSSDLDLASPDPSQIRFRSPLPSVDYGQLTPGSTRSAASAPNLAVGRQPTQLLSVITEGEEESLSSRTSSKRKRHLQRQQHEVLSTPEYAEFSEQQTLLSPPSEGSLARRRSLDPPKTLALLVAHRSQSRSEGSLNE